MKKYIFIGFFFVISSIASAQVILPAYQWVFSTKSGTVASAPSSPVATSGYEEATVSFSAPTSDGGSDITGYTVTSTPGEFTASGAASPISLSGLSNGTSYTFRVVATNALGNSVASVASNAVIPQFVCGTSTVTFTYKGASVTYGIVSRAYGGTVGTKCWLDRNLGATQVATSSTDANAYGDLYQWGRGADGHQIRTSSTTNTKSATDVPGNALFIMNSVDWRSTQNDNLWKGVNDINNPCPSGYRIPTETEINAEKSSWSTLNAAGALASPLKLPLAGYRNTGGSLSNVGTHGRYWSSSVSGINAQNLYDHSTAATITSNIRAYGFSVRCIND